MRTNCVPDASASVLLAETRDLFVMSFRSCSKVSWLVGENGFCSLSISILNVGYFTYTRCSIVEMKAGILSEKYAVSKIQPSVCSVLQQSSEYCCKSSILVDEIISSKVLLETSGISSRRISDFDFPVKDAAVSSIEAVSSFTLTLMILLQSSFLGLPEFAIVDLPF